MAKILIKNKKEKEKTHNIYDKEIYGRFRYIAEYKNHNIDNQNPIFLEKFKNLEENEEESDTFKLLPKNRQTEIQEQINKNEFSFSKLNEIERKIFFDFAQKQTILCRWVPFWEIQNFIPDLNISGISFFYYKVIYLQKRQTQRHFEVNFIF